MAAVMTAGVVGGCSDPVRSDARDALGPETNVPKGPLHRPNQPCLVCHDGSHAPEFSMAGTVYVSPYASSDTGETIPRVPLVDGVVTIVGADGASYRVAVNCAGNFFILPSQFTPIYPAKVSVAYGDTTVGMESLIRREGSCGACHGDPPGPASAGHAFLEELNPPTPRVCP